MKKSALYAPRLRGDIDLGLEPSRVDSQGNKKWAVIGSPGGILPGGVFQDIHKESENQNYRIGTRRVVDDRTFHYCKAGSAIAIPQRGVANASPHLECTCIGNAVAGKYTLDLALTCADFPAVTYVDEDDYAGGWLWIMAGGDHAPARHEFHRILHNDDSTGDPAYVRVYLETPIVHSQDTPWITAYPNIYANCQQAYPTIPTNKQAIVCMTACGLTVTNGRYFWGQTWGPTWTTAVSGEADLPGKSDRQRQLVFWQGGVIELLKLTTPGTYSHQVAGYVLSNTVNTGDMMFMLQLAP